MMASSHTLDHNEDLQGLDYILLVDQEYKLGHLDPYREDHNYLLGYQNWYTHRQYCEVEILKESSQQGLNLL